MSSVRTSLVTFFALLICRYYDILLIPPSQREGGYSFRILPRYFFREEIFDLLCSLLIWTGRCAMIVSSTLIDRWFLTLLLATDSLWRRKVRASLWRFSHLALFRCLTALPLSYSWFGRDRLRCSYSIWLTLARRSLALFATPVCRRYSFGFTRDLADFVVVWLWTLSGLRVDDSLKGP